MKMKRHGNEDGSEWTMTEGYGSKKDKFVFHHKSRDGFKARGSRLADALNAKYVHRARGYVMSRRKAERLLFLLSEGWDATILGRELIEPKPRMADEKKEAK